MKNRTIVICTWALASALLACTPSDPAVEAKPSVAASEPVGLPLTAPEEESAATGETFLVVHEDGEGRAAGTETLTRGVDGSWSRTSALEGGFEETRALNTQEDPAFHGDHRTLAIIINFQDLTHPPDKECTVERLQNALFHDAESVNAFFNAMSTGQITFSGDVVGPITIPHSSDSDCRTDYPIWSESALELVSEQVEVDSYDHILFLFPFGLPHCGLGASGTVGAPGRSWYYYSDCTVALNDEYGAGIKATVSHELGHNLGLRHANATEHSLPYEYQDYLDFMGAAWMRANGPHMISLGLKQATEVTSDGTYELRPLHASPSADGEIIKIQAGGKSFFVSYRVDQGWDALFWSRLQDRYAQKMQVHEWNEIPGHSTHILHYASEGDHFIAENVRIDHLAYSPTSMTIAVDFDPGYQPSCTDGDGQCPGVHMCSPSTDAECVEEPFAEGPKPNLVAHWIDYDGSDDAISILTCNIGIPFTASRPLVYGLYGRHGIQPCFGDRSSRTEVPPEMQAALEQRDCYTLRFERSSELMSGLEMDCGFTPGNAITLDYAIEPDSTEYDYETSSNSVQATHTRQAAQTDFSCERSQFNQVVWSEDDQVEYCCREDGDGDDVGVLDRDLATCAPECSLGETKNFYAAYDRWTDPPEMAHPNVAPECCDLSHQCGGVGTCMELGFIQDPFLCAKVGTNVSAIYQCTDDHFGEMFPGSFAGERITCVEGDDPRVSGVFERSYQLLFGSGGPGEVTAEVDGVEVFSGGFVAAGASVRLTATASADLSTVFGKWTGDVDYDPIGNHQSATRVITMDSPKAVVAHFTRPPWVVRASMMGPSDGSDETFVLVYKDADGASELSKATFWLDGPPGGYAGDLAFQYFPQTNSIKIFNDAGVPVNHPDAPNQLVYVDSMAPDLSNSQGTIHVSQISVQYYPLDSDVQRRLVMRVPVSFSPTYTGDKTIKMYCEDFLGGESNSGSATSVGVYSVSGN